MTNDTTPHQIMRWFSEPLDTSDKSLLDLHLEIFWNQYVLYGGNFFRSDEDRETFKQVFFDEVHKSVIPALNNKLSELGY